MRNLYYLLGILTRMKQLFGGAMLFFLAFCGGLFFLIYTADAFTGTFTNVVGSRAFDTQYQNTTDNDLYVTATLSIGEGNYCRIVARMGSASANSDVSRASVRSGDASTAQNVWMVVPPDYYYGVYVEANSGGCTDSLWWEYETPVMSGGGGGGATTTEMVILSGTTTTNNPTQDMFNGIILFGFVALFFIWFFRRPYDTF